ncbi:MAG: hypothetical protein M1825_001344 [Sarcosagium campestre]|nr:MAG: hypothetical protein M1825_001344 [Sarcosagium campestre]
MSYYENQPWQNPARQQTWEQPPPPSRSGASSTIQHEDPSAFSCQFEEVDRAVDNLVKSGKMFNMPGRRDSLPPMGNGNGPRAFSDFGDPRMGGPTPQRHHSLSEYDPLRSHSGSNLQNYYANQRYQARPNEAEQMMQSKRRMAAQRERELRNYHQEQQYNRTVLSEISTQGKPERAMSPSAMNEDDRRDLIARQHRALYGNEAAAYPENGTFGSDSHTPRPLNQGSGANSNNGAVPSSEHQGHQSSTQGPSPIQPQQRSRANSNSSPSSNPTSFSLFDNAAQQSSRTSTSSPGGSPPRQASKTAANPVGPGVAPIGTRPGQANQAQASNPALNKRSTTPLPSPLSYGFAPNEESSSNERSTSAASNPSAGAQDHGVGLGWGSKGGVWGNKNSLGVQASVWG